jgi:hypothetical protein
MRRSKHSKTEVKTELVMIIQERTAWENQHLGRRSRDRDDEIRHANSPSDGSVLLLGAAR